MGCEQSDALPLINGLTLGQGQNNHSRPQQKQTQQQVYAQPQYTQYSQTQQNYQQPPQQQQNYHQQGQAETPSYYPAQQGITSAQPTPQVIVPTNTTEVKVGGVGKRSKPRAPRQYLQIQANMNDDFLTHHLKYQLSLSRLTNMKRIKRRQLLEHLHLKAFWNTMRQTYDIDLGLDAFRESLVSAWIQRTFLDIWEQAHDDFFVKHLEEKEVRRKVSEQYMFQLFELKEYVDSGLATLSWILPKSQLELFTFVSASDDALFNIFKKLKDRYPQTGGGGQKMQFPDVPSTKTNMDLLNNFNKLSFSDPANMNYQTIYQDINFLLKRAIQEKDTFKTDMQDILGDDVLACPKVNQVTKDGKKSFNACAVRRVFVKWAQNLLEKCPDLIYTKTFMKFIKSRSQIVNNFIFKSTITSTTHKIVIDCISLLLEVAKYGLTDKKKRDEFIFNIYDLLRCKIKRNTPNEIVDLLKKMQSTTITKSGKKFEVIRVKNRFKTNNRDLLINFRYGDVLVGQAQLCIDSAGVAKQTKLNYEFCHYIYELQRSLFGPTLQLMMQYQDFQRPDITVSFQAEDLVLPRGNQIIQKSGQTDRKCLQGHDMITIAGNFFIGKQSPDETDEQSIKKDYACICNFCDGSSSVQQPYDYCYHCGCYLCTNCRQQYKKFDYKKFLLSIQREEMLPAVSNFNEIKKLCSQNKSILVLFWLQDSSASTLFKDSIIYHQGKLQMQPGKYIPKIFHSKFNASSSFKDLCNKYQITQYPTLVLLNEQAQAVRTMIGFSWFDLPIFYQTQQRLIQGKNICFEIKCQDCNGAKMTAIQMTQQAICLSCLNVNKPVNMPPQIQKIGAFCENGHHRCISCCYAALECPSTYKDFWGQTYLSSTYTSPKLPKCQKGHQTTLSRANPTQSWIFRCFKCNQDKFFDNQHGTGECGQCKSFVCSHCIGATLPTFKQLKAKSDMVTHFVESTAEEACGCVCTRNFKKAYSGRVLSFEQISNEKSDKWNCIFCKKVGQNGKLHIACFDCPAMQKYIGQKMNLQICLNCAGRAKILMKEVVQKAVQQPSVFLCPKDKNPLFLTSCKSNQQLTVNCHFCKKNYFVFTERLNCKTCNLNCCSGCRQRIVQKGLVPKCRQRCPQGHQLKFNVIDKKGLQLCDGCLEVIREDAFKCEYENYTLCTSCVINKPANFIGKGMDGFIAGQNGYVDLEQQYKNQDNDYGATFQGYQQPQQEEYGLDNFVKDFFS